jgi:alkylhydroperoxidase/carboxymuconolactone decarboxylase family protein YurZ
MTEQHRASDEVTALNPYGYSWWEWVAREAPDYVKARNAMAAQVAGEGQQLSIKYREMIMIAILAYQSRQQAVVAHMRRAIAHGATKCELLEALQSAAYPAGAPTFSVGVQALIQLDEEGVFANERLPS